VVGLGTLLTALAGSSVNLALPSLGRDLGISMDAAGWVIQSLLLASTVMLLGAGRAADRYGASRVYLAGFGLFGVASLACGLAPSYWLLLAARVVQGVGGALVMASGPALLTGSHTAATRGRALGALSTATYTGLSLGPPVGGLLIDGLGWRWVFLLNVPVAVILLLLGRAWLPTGQRGEGRGMQDPVGFALVLGAFPALLVGVAQGHRWGWDAPATLACLAAGAVGLAAFLRWEARHASPLLDLGIFRSVVFSASVASALLNYVALFIPLLLLPYYLVEARDLSEREAGLLLSVQPVIMALVALPSGALSDRLGSRGLATAGMLGLAGALALLARVDAGTGIAGLAVPLGLMGLGTGVFISPNSSALMGAAPRGLQGTAGGVLALARNLGMILGVSLAILVFQHAGGRTGAVWGAGELAAFRIALWAAAGVALAAALVSAVRGGRAAPEA
jgi:EmrB/QacA subfamily drug resistance transporter